MNCSGIKLSRVNWGIIGCGNVTEHKSGPAFGKVNASRVVAVMRRDEAKARDYAKRHDIPAWYTRADDLISDPDVNAVYVATPPSSHAEYAISAMKQGKAVYVEKPMASHYNDCLKMQQVAIETGMPLYVAYYRRALPYFIRVKELIDSGKLGELLYAKVDFQTPPREDDYNFQTPPWRVIPEIAGGGYFYDMACHQLDLLDWTLGPASEISARCFNRRGLYQVEDLVTAHIIYNSEVPLTGSWCYASGEGQQTDKIFIYGTQGSLEFSTFTFTPVRFTTPGGIMEFNPPNPENIQFCFIQNMVEELRGIRPIHLNIESAVRTNLIMDKILGKL